MNSEKLNLEKWFSDKLAEFKNDEEFILEGIILRFNEKIAHRMKTLNMTRSNLAEKLGVSKAFVTKVLNGAPNLTVKTMNSIATALDCDIEINLRPKEKANAKVELSISGNITAKKHSERVYV